MSQTAPPSAVERGEDTRAALVSAGRSLFAQRGFDGTSVRDITREAGVNLGSKRGLYEAVLRAGLNPMVDRVEEAAEGGGCAVERLEAVVDVFFEHLAANPELPRLLLQEVAAGKTPPAEVVAILRRNARNVGRILSDGWADGSLRPGHPLLSAISVVSQPIYMTVVAPLLLEVGGVDLRDPETRRMAARHVKDFVRAGLESREEQHR